MSGSLKQLGEVHDCIYDEWHVGNQEEEALWEGMMLHSSPFQSSESCAGCCNPGGEQKVSSWVS